MISLAVKRQLKKAKHYYLTIVLSLAFTLAMVFSVFSIVDAVYLKPLPYGHADHIYHINGLIDFQGKEERGSNPPGLFYVKKHSSLIAEMAIYLTFGEQKIYSLSERPNVPVYFTSPDFFKLIQTKPFLGRFFNEQEKLGNKQPSAVLSYQAWQKFFNGNVDIIGKKVQLEQRSYTIVGVAPDNWTLPNFNDVSESIWLPQDMSRFDPERYTGFTSNFSALARFKPGVSIEQVLQEISPMYYKGAELLMPKYTKILSPTLKVLDLPTSIRGDSGAVVFMLIIGASLLIFIALVNLGNLQMARAAGRIQPLAISYAFGATRKQIFKELFSHNLYVATFASLFGLLLTWLGFAVIRNIGSEVLPRMDTLGLSFYMLLFAMLMTLIIAMIFSWIEMQAADENNLKANLQSSGKGTGKQMRKGVSHVLIGLQLCFSVLTLVATSQVLFTTLSEALRSNHIVTDDLWSVKLGYAGIENIEERKNINRAVIELFKANPAVKNVSASSEMRVDGVNRNFIYNENNEQIASVRRVRMDIQQLELFDIKVQGRSFNKGDYDLEFHPVIINQRLAGYFSNNPIGQKIILDDKKAHKIIGIASNTDYPGASYLEDGEVYIPGEYSGWRSYVLLLETKAGFDGFNKIKALKELLKIDPRLDLTSILSVSEQFLELSKNQRFAAYIAGVLSLVSLVMVIAGILGMVSYMVNMRRYDLGVKMAMGATSKTLLKSQLLELSVPLAVSILFAFSVVIFTLGYSRTVPEWVFAIQWGMVVYALLLLIVITLVACFLPIAKVLKGDPIKALRNE